MLATIDLVVAVECLFVLCIRRPAVGAVRTSALAAMVGAQPEPASEAEQALRAAIEAGNKHALTDLGDLSSKRTGDFGTLWRTWVAFFKPTSRRAESEAAYRRAIEAGATEALLDLSMLLLKQKGREREAETV